MAANGSVGEVTQELIDTFASEVAILDSAGQIVIASKAWKARAERFYHAEDRKSVAERGALAFLSSDKGTSRLIEKKVSRILSGELAEAKLNFAAKVGNFHRRYSLRATQIRRGALLGAVIVNDDVTEVYELYRDKRHLADELIQSEEKERRRIAREMHDSTVQDLVAIGLNLKRLPHRPNDAVAQEVLSEVRKILARTQQDVRTLSYLLHPPLLEEGGLVLALASLIHGLSNRMKIQVEFQTDVSDCRLPIDIEMALYRVAQEALINVHKHASATRALVRYQREPDRFVLEVEDDGVGLGGQHGYHVGSGVGIQGMRARLHQLGGTLTLSSLSQGTRVMAVIPIAEPLD